MPNRCLGCGEVLEERVGAAHECPHAPPSVLEVVQQIRKEARLVLGHAAVQYEIDYAVKRTPAVRPADLQMLAITAAQVAIARARGVNPALISMSDDDLAAETLASGLFVASGDPQ